MASVPHSGTEEGQWVAACTAPDVCIVGGTPVPFDTTAILSNNWAGQNPVTNVTGHQVRIYRETDMLQQVNGNAGSGISSGVSQGGGHVLFLPPPPHNVFIANQQIVVNENQCMINTNAGGGGGTPGQLYTDVNSVASTVGDGLTYTDWASKAAEQGMTRDAYRQGGRFVSRESLKGAPIAEYGRSAERLAKPGMGRAVGGLRSAGKVLGPAGNIIGGVASASDQLAQDAARTDLTQGEKYGRAATRAGLEGGGGAAGAAAGAAIGVWFFGWGAIPGAIIGGYLGGKGGKAAADHVLADRPAPKRMSGAARRAARHGKRRSGG